MSSFDTAQYMGLFLAEVEEQLTTLNQSLMALEQSDSDPDLIQRLFRVAHILKGSSATMGLDMMAGLTHRLEDILDDVRHGQAKVTVALIDTLFACLDRLQAWRDELAAGAFSLQPAPELLERLEKVRSGPEPVDFPGDFPEINLTPELIQQSEEYQRQGWWVGTVGVRIADSCPLPAVRAYLAYNNAYEWGEVLTSAPEVDVLLLGEYQGHLTLWMAVPGEHGEGLKGLHASIMQLAEIAEVELKEWVSGVGNADNGGPVKSSEAHDYVRIEVSRLDTLMNLVGELVIDRARLSQIEIELGSRLDGDITGALGEVSRHIALVAGELQEKLLKLRTIFF